MLVFSLILKWISRKKKIVKLNANFNAKIDKGFSEGLFQIVQKANKRWSHPSLLLCSYVDEVLDNRIWIVCTHKNKNAMFISIWFHIVYLFISVIAGLYNVTLPVPPPPMAIVYQEMSPPAPDHMEELRRNQATTPIDTQPTGSLTASSDEPNPEVTSLVTKSLSALKSRKEQIIGN